MSESDSVSGLRSRRSSCAIYSGFGGRREGHTGFRCEIQEGEGFLQVQVDVSVVVAQVADRHVLAEVKIEVPAPGCYHEGSVNSGRPNDFAFDQTLDVFKDRIAVIAGFGERGVSVGAEQDGI